MEKTNSQNKNMLTRMKQSVSGLLDLATKVQLSYVRTIQLTVPLPSDVPRKHYTPSTRRSGLQPKAEGYRASAKDVTVFSPRMERVTARELNLTSEHNIPLLEPEQEPSIPRQSCVALSCASPSPLRPRYIPLSPEWRLRPVSNPVTLRLRALQNILGERGVPWEGRSHSGSLGCGRERLTGVAFEGLGGSRLAFEATCTLTTSRTDHC